MQAVNFSHGSVTRHISDPDDADGDVDIEAWNSAQGIRTCLEDGIGKTYKPRHDTCVSDLTKEWSCQEQQVLEPASPVVRQLVSDLLTLCKYDPTTARLVRYVKGYHAVMANFIDHEPSSSTGIPEPTVPTTNAPSSTRIMTRLDAIREARMHDVLQAQPLLAHLRTKRRSTTVWQLFRALELLPPLWELERITQDPRVPSQ